MDKAAGSGYAGSTVHLLIPVPGFWRFSYKLGRGPKKNTSSFVCVGACACVRKGSIWLVTTLLMEWPPSLMKSIHIFKALLLGRPQVRKPHSWYCQIYWRSKKQWRDYFLLHEHLSCSTPVFVYLCGVIQICPAFLHFLLGSHFTLPRRRKQANKQYKYERKNHLWMDSWGALTLNLEATK